MDGMDQTQIAVGFQPVEDNVLIRPVPTEDLPGAVTGGAVAWGDVVAVGPGRRTPDGTLLVLTVVPGDRVALRPGSAMPLRLAGQSLAIVGGPDVLGLLPQGAAGQVLAAPGTGAVGLAAAEPPAILAEDSLETNVAPDRLNHEAPTSEDLH